MLDHYSLETSICRQSLIYNYAKENTSCEEDGRKKMYRYKTKWEEDIKRNMAIEERKH